MYIADIEGDGLLDELTTLHCLVAKKYLQDKVTIACDKERLPEDFVESLERRFSIEWIPHEEISSFLEGCGALCIHNLFDFDLPALKQLGFIGSYEVEPDLINDHNVRLIDTLSMSRMLYPDRPLPHGCPAKVYNPVTGKMDTVGPHGLMAWGYRVSNAKPKVHDWRNQPLEVYVNRCVEDVIINELVMTALLKERDRKPLGDNTPKIGLQSDNIFGLKLNNTSDYLMAKQKEDGVLFDQDAAWELLDKIDVMMQNLADEVEQKLPLRELPKSQQPTFPSKPFREDGSISSTGYNWLERLGYDINKEAFELAPIPAKPFKSDGSLSSHGERFCEKMGWGNFSQEEKKQKIKEERLRKEEVKPLSEIDAKNAIRDLKSKLMPDIMVPMRIGDQDAIKEYLVETQGWRPTIWNTKDITKDSNKQPTSEEDQEIKLIEYIESSKASLYREFIEQELDVKFSWRQEKIKKVLERKKRYLVTSPKFKDERGDLCPSLELLDGEMAKAIVKYMSLRNRRSVIKTLDEKKNTGWLNNPRLKIDGRIGQGNSGVTNTNRYKHREIVNLPKAAPDVLLGKEMRSLFVAPPGKKILGYDGSNLEQFIAGSYAWMYDKGDYLSVLLEGDSHEENAKAYTRAAGREITRSAGKNVTYACLPIDNTEVLTAEGWKKYDALRLSKDIIKTFNTDTEKYEEQVIDEIITFHDVDVYKMSNECIAPRNKSFCVECTLDHRWYGKRLINNKWEKTFFTVEDIKADPKKYYIYTGKEYVWGSHLTVSFLRKTSVFCLGTFTTTFLMRQSIYHYHNFRDFPEIITTSTITGNCLYGAQANKIANMLGITKEKAQSVIDAFWDTNIGLKKLKVALEAYWESTGKRYVRGIDGRKIYTRSKHSLVNALFQSAGAILMSLSGIIMYKELKKAGLLDKGVIRLLYVHDEYQYEVPDELIEEYWFDTKEEAEKFVLEGRKLSNIKEVKGRFVRYYSIVGELGDLSLKKAGQMLNMPVEFCADYDIGYNLAETH